MSIEDNLNLHEVMFFTAVKKYPENIKRMYELYQDYHTKQQEYIWYKGIETGISYINEVYNGKYKQK